MAKTKTKKSGSRLPAFRDDAEERKFWETHTPGAYVEQLRPGRVRVSKQFSKHVKTRGRPLRQERAG